MTAGLTEEILAVKSKITSQKQRQRNRELFPEILVVHVLSPG
jgi:hypothetical protein